MNERTKYLAKNVGVLAVSNFASKILVFLLVPLYTSVLTTEEFGVFDIVITTIILVFPLLTLNIVDALMRFLMDSNNSKEEVATISLRFILYSTLPILFFLVTASKLQQFSLIHGLESYIFLYYLFSCLNQYFIQFAKGTEMVLAMGIAGFFSTVAMLAGNIVFLLVLKSGLPGFFIANILGQAVPVFYLALKTKIWLYIRKSKVNKILQREMLLYCVPIIATRIGWWVNSSAGKYVVSFICGVASTGLLAVSYKIPAIINTLQSVFIQAWQISAIKEYGATDAPIFYGNTFNTLNAFMATVCSLLILFTKPIASILFHNEFFIAWQYVPFLLVAIILNGASGFLGPILSAKKDSKSLALSAVYAASVNLILNIILVYLIGIQGSAIATVASSYVIYHVRKNAVGHDITIKDYNVIYLTWLLLCLQALCQIYTSFLWLSIVTFVLILLLNKKSVSQVVVTARGLKQKI